MYYVYTLSHPITGDIGYVGITDNPYRRFRQHLAAHLSEGKRRYAWIEGLRQQNLVPSIKIVETPSTYDEAVERENFWIRYYLDQGATLCNTQTSFNETPVEIRKPAKRPGIPTWPYWRT